MVKMTTITPTASPAPRTFAILLGIAIPAVAFSRVVFAVIVGLALIALFFSRPLRDIIRDLWTQCQTPVGILILLTFAAWLPNVFNSNFPLRSFVAVSRTLIFVGVAAAFYSCLSTDQRLVKVSLRAFTVMAGVSVTFALVSMTALPELYWALRLKGWVSHPIGTNLKGFSALAVLIVPVLVMAGYRSPLVWRAVSAITSAAYLVFVWESYNRSAIAGFLAAALAIVMAILVQKGTKKSVFAALSIAGVLIVGVIVWLRMTRGFFLDHSPQGTWVLPVWLVDYERQIIWERALEFASTAPWFGIGANTINFVPGADAIIEGTGNLHVIPAHPHNWGVEVYAETGAVGLAALLLTIVVVAAKALLGVRRSGSLGLICAIAILAGYWGSGLFNFSYWSAWWQMSFFVSLATVLHPQTRSLARPLL